MRRYGSIIKIKPEKLEEYKKLHANVWPNIKNIIKSCNIRNYSIYHRDGFLFGYFEYLGNNFEEDMNKLAAYPETQDWWNICKPMQIPLDTRKNDEWWVYMEEVFHQD